MSPAEGGDDGDETGLEKESAAQTSLDDFTQPDASQQSSLFDDEESIEKLRASIESRDRSFGRPFFPESSPVRVVEELRQSTDLMVNGIVQDAQRVFDKSLHQTVQKLQRASVSARMTGVIGTAFASSVVGSTAAAGVDPSMFNTLGQPAIIGIEQIMNEISTEPVAELGDAALWSAVRTMDALSEVAKNQMDSTAELAAQLGEMGSGAVTAGVVAGSTAELRVGQAFERPEVSWPSVEPEASWPPRESESVIEPTAPVTDQDLEPSWWPGERVRDCSSEILRVYVLGVVDFSMACAYVLYPEYRTMILLSSPLLMIPLHWALLFVWPTD